MAELHDRGTDGFATYAKGMDGSMGDKARILPYVRPGTIVEFGCGNGAILELLRSTQPDSRLIGVDLSTTMLSLAHARMNGLVSLVEADLRALPFATESVDTIVCASVLHEVYSYSDYDRNAVRRVLADAYAALKPGGRLIIRDGVRPQNDLVLLAFKNEKTQRLFERFAHDFSPHPIHYEWRGGLARLSRCDAMEFLSKYRYEQNWNIEVREQFGVFTLPDYEHELETQGFRVLHGESYLIPWLRETHYKHDVTIYRQEAGHLVEQEYPDSTLLLVAEKPVEATP